MFFFSDRSAARHILTSQTQHAETTRPQRPGNRSQAGQHMQGGVEQWRKGQIHSPVNFVCCCLCRIHPWQRTEGRLRRLWPTGKSISWRSCPSNSNTPCQTWSVYDQQCCLLLCAVAYRASVQSHLLPDFCSLSLFCRTWDCLQDEEGVTVRTSPATTCIRTDTNLPCALNVAVS